MSLINIAEAARVAGCSDKTLRRAIDEGKLKVQPRKVPNHPIMVDVEDLQAYLAERRGVQVEVMEVKVSPLPVKEKPSRSGSDSALVDRITELERIVHDLLMDQRGDVTELNVLLSHAGEDAQQQDTGLAGRVAELEQTIRTMQEEFESHRLLGGSPDYLALGPADDVHYENRMDALELENKRLGGLVVTMQDTLLEVLTRLTQLDKDQAMDIATLTGQLERIDAKIGARLDHDSKRISDLVDRVAHLELSARYGDKADTSEVDALFARNPGLQDLVEREKAKYEVETDAFFTLADFTQLLLPEYRSSAERKDVRAWLTLRPEPLGVQGDYRVDYFESGRTDGKRQAMKREQAERGNQLKDDLRVKVVNALFQAGWQKGPHDIWVCPKPAN